MSAPGNHRAEPAAAQHEPPFGQLFLLVPRESDDTVEATLVRSRGKAADRLSIPDALIAAPRPRRHRFVAHWPVQLLYVPARRTTRAIQDRPMAT